MSTTVTNLLKHLLEDEDDEILDADEFLAPSKDILANDLVRNLHISGISVRVTPVLKSYVPSMQEMSTEWGIVLISPPPPKDGKHFKFSKDAFIVFEADSPSFDSLSEDEALEYIQKSAGVRCDVNPLFVMCRPYALKVHIYLDTWHDKEKR